jgi:hypothetical protein
MIMGGRESFHGTEFWKGVSFIVFLFLSFGWLAYSKDSSCSFFQLVVFRLEIVVGEVLPLSRGREGVGEENE